MCGIDNCKNERDKRGKMLIASCPPRPPCSMRTHNMPSVVCGPTIPQGGARRWNSKGMVLREETVRGENKKHGEANGEEECEEKREEEEEEEEKEEEEISQCFPEALDVQPQRWIRVRRSSES
eukprot:GHVU01147160.1.p2 GENE.GHVU01147160.1~~GHVU01147160.1.p2  ORF type:complete len:123 (+),score=30.54 GHVU01147160.1:186-554(+)